MTTSGEEQIHEENEFSLLGGPHPSCPECDSTRVFKDGFRKSKDGKIQRFICRDCGFRFSEPSKVQSQNEIELEGDTVSNEYSEIDPDEQYNTEPEGLVDSHSGAFLGEDYKKHTLPETHRLVCAEEAKNLAATQVIGNVVAGDIDETKTLLVQYSFYLQKRGNREATIRSRVDILKLLYKRGAIINDPESVKQLIAQQKWADKRKCNAVDAYTLLLRMQGKKWDPPKFKVTKKLPFIPKESELDVLIAGSGPKLSSFLQLLKETGARAGEAHNIRWSDIDFETNTVRITPEKGSNPRIIKITPNLATTLQRLRFKSKTRDPNRIFEAKIRNLMQDFRDTRRRIAAKTGNQRLLQIHFHTFRHWKATMLYHQTKDPLRVQRFLGHTTFQHTMVYIHLEEALFQDTNDDYLCKTATTAEEARALIEVGFEYVNEIQGIHLYRKRK
jgi:integrase